MEKRVAGRPLQFGHPARIVAFWRHLFQQAVDLLPTPFYLLSIEPIKEALAELRALEEGVAVPVRHWLSCKTQPVAPLLRWWNRQGSGIEVVSEFEFLAASHEGFPPEQILVNGPAKHRWLPAHPVERIRVNFDSLTELRALLPLARQLDWSVGVRCQSGPDANSGLGQHSNQFGMDLMEAAAALRKLTRSGVRTETIHFHYGTNVELATLYSHGLWKALLVCQAARFAPKYLDCGGGLPPHHVLSADGLAYDRRFQLPKLAAIFRQALDSFPSVREIWMENGRFVSARSGILAVRIHDIKDRGDIRHLICDGGRTSNALISNWEAHEIFSVPRRGGASRLTAICGPTCMAFDQLTCRPMSSQLRIGDYLVWMDAGAYHVPWETRFSHGCASVLWHEEGAISVVRKPESFDSWWGQWQGDAKGNNSRPVP